MYFLNRSEGATKPNWTSFFDNGDLHSDTFDAKKFEQHCIKEARALCITAQQLGKHRLIVPNFEPADLEGIENPDIINQIQRIRCAAFAEAAKTTQLQIDYFIWPGSTYTDRRKARDSKKVLEACLPEEQLTVGDVTKALTTINTTELEDVAIVVSSSPRIQQELNRIFTLPENVDPKLNLGLAEKLEKPQEITLEEDTLLESKNDPKDITKDMTTLSDKTAIRLPLGTPTPTTPTSTPATTIGDQGDQPQVFQNPQNLLFLS